MSKVYILNGSNMGDREEYLSNALQLIGSRCGTITAFSQLYESEPWGFDAEQWFLNQALELSTEINPYELLSSLLDIERDLGRCRKAGTIGYSSRPIDIDILYYDDVVITTHDLVLPHPLLQERRFVLMPLCSIAPDMVHPVLGVSQRELLEKCCDKSEVRPYKNITKSAYGA